MPMWTTDSFVLGRGCPNSQYSTPAMLNFFVSACDIDNLTWILMALLRDLNTDLVSLRYPAITPGLILKTLLVNPPMNTTAMGHLPMVVMPLRAGAKPHAHHTLQPWPFPKRRMVICSLLVNAVDHSLPNHPCWSVVNSLHAKTKIYVLLKALHTVAA